MVGATVAAGLGVGADTSLTAADPRGKAIGIIGGPIGIAAARAKRDGGEGEGCGAQNIGKTGHGVVPC